MVFVSSPVFIQMAEENDLPLCRPLSLCYSALLPRTPLRSLLQPRLHPLRSTLYLPMTTQSAADPSPLPPIKTVRVLIKGGVQGVFYRNWTIENATLLCLKGWVRNKRDGSVEALFSGDPDNVREMEQRCRRGPTRCPGYWARGFTLQ